LPSGLLALAEEDLPVPSEHLHAVGVPVPGGVLICAVAAELLTELDEATLSLHPEQPPPGIEAECARLNLLVGAYEPRPLRRARERRHALAAGTLVLCGLLAAVGLARRTAHWNAAAEAAEQAWTAAARAQSPESGSAPSEASTLLFDLRRIADRLDGVASVRPPRDAALALAALLEQWPAEVASKPQSIAVRPGEVSVSVLVVDAPAFLAALHPPDGWTMSQPMLNTSGELTRLTLMFQRPAEAVKGGV